MTLRPVDSQEVSEEEIKALEHPEAKPEVKPAEVEPSVPGREPSKETPEPTGEKETKPPEDGEKVPFHKDPQVQLYIERQVARRIGEGQKAFEDRIDRLETSLKQAQQPTDISIGGWTPGNENEAKAARAIVLQAKREMAQELSALDSKEREALAEEDRDFSDWLGELRTTGVLSDDKDEIEFSRLVAEYGIEDRQAAVNLWERLADSRVKAKEEGEKEGEKKGIKKAQEANVGTSRKSGEPGEKPRTYQQRMTEEPNFDAIVEREMTRLGQ